MPSKENRFIVFLSLCFIFIALFVKTTLAGAKPILSLTDRRETWKITQKEAMKIVSEESEAKKFLDQGEIREETETEITISQPSLEIESLPTEEDPFWEIHLFEKIIEIPKDGKPRTHIISFQKYQVEVTSGKVEKIF